LVLLSLPYLWKGQKSGTSNPDTVLLCLTSIAEYVYFCILCSAEPSLPTDSAPMPENRPVSQLQQTGPATTAAQIFGSRPGHTWELKGCVEKLPPVNLGEKRVSFTYYVGPANTYNPQLNLAMPMWTQCIMTQMCWTCSGVLCYRYCHIICPCASQKCTMLRSMVWIGE